MGAFSHSLGHLAALAIVAHQVRQIAAATEDGLGVFVPRVGHQRMQVGAHVAEPFGGAIVHQRLRLRHFNVELPLNPYALSPYEAQFIALILARSAGVTRPGSTPKTRDAVTVAKSIPTEGLDQALVLAGMGHDAHLDLRIVR